MRRTRRMVRKRRNQKNFLAGSSSSGNSSSSKNDDDSNDDDDDERNDKNNDQHKKLTDCDDNENGITGERRRRQQPPKRKKKKLLRVSFLHLDLGIGGAEQLVLQLAAATHRENIPVAIYTTRCDADHCFAAVKYPDGYLSRAVTVAGRWIPSAVLFGKGRAIMSTFRVLYLACCLARREQQQQSRYDCDEYDHVIVADVLPSALPLLRATTDAALLFYCHFPDKLLVRSASSSGAAAAGAGGGSGSGPSAGGGIGGVLNRRYRNVLDWIEESTMSAADKVCVNSKFTRRTVVETFPSLASSLSDGGGGGGGDGAGETLPREEEEETTMTASCEKDDNDNDDNHDNDDDAAKSSSLLSFDPTDDLPVLYPALDTTSLDRNRRPACNDDDKSASTAAAVAKKKKNMIVSLNRFERKKNLQLLLDAAVWLEENFKPPPNYSGSKTKSSSSSSSATTTTTTKTTGDKEKETTSENDNVNDNDDGGGGRTTTADADAAADAADDDWRPEVVIAGGYDRCNVENVEHRAELQRAAAPLRAAGWKVSFRPSVSDADRAALLADAACVVYTPKHEHFGIVPLEAMYSGTAVVASNTGGPVETVLHGRTGYLCDDTAESFGAAIGTLLSNPEKAVDMGRAGRDHVRAVFGEERLAVQWKQLLHETVAAAAAGRRKRQRLQGYSGSSIALRTIMYLSEIMVALVLCVLVTWLFRRMGILQQNESILGKFRETVRNVVLQRDTSDSETDGPDEF